MEKRYSKIIIATIIICLTFTNIGYTNSLKEVKSLVLINLLNHTELYNKGIHNSLYRLKIANLIEEDYQSLRQSIISAHWKNDLSNQTHVFSPMLKEESIYLLDQYATLKNLEIKASHKEYESINLTSSNALNRLITANILDESVLTEPLTFSVIKKAISKIDTLSHKKQMIAHKITPILEKYSEKLRANEHINFNLVHSQTGANISYNSRVTNHPASIIKTFYLYVFLKEVESGKRSLEDTRVFLNKDKYSIHGNRIGGSGILQSSKANVTYTWGELLRLMIIESDNVATSIVMYELGTKTLENWTRKSGLENTHITGPIYTAAGRPTKSTAEDLTKTLYLLDTLPEKLRDFALKQMEDCKAKDRIAKDITNIKWLGNKSGTLGDYVGDSAIIRYGNDDNNTIYMTIILRTTDDKAINIFKSENIIAQISSEIVDQLKSINDIN